MFMLAAKCLFPFVHLYHLGSAALRAEKVPLGLCNGKRSLAGTCCTLNLLCVLGCWESGMLDQVEGDDHVRNQGCRQSSGWADTEEDGKQSSSGDVLAGSISTIPDKNQHSVISFL